MNSIVILSSDKAADAAPNLVPTELLAMQGRAAVVLCRVTTEPAGRVVLRTAIGGSRVIPLPIGEQLPWIC